MAWSLTMDSAQGLVSSLQGGSQKHHNHGRRPRPVPLMDQDDLGLDLDLDLDLDFDEFVDELSSSTPPEKKRRLTVEQVKFLEASFNTDIKLEPDRKALIASQLGLRPRQVAIWFQNRRVRWKNKQLERDYDVLKDKYETLMKENVAMTKEKDTVAAENQKLQAKVAHLTTLLETSKKHMSVTIVDDQGVNLTSLPDFDSDCESGSKELTSITKSSEDLSDIRDSGQSESASHHDVIVAIVDPPIEEEFEPEQHSMFFVEECAMYPLLFFQHLSNVDDPFSISCWEAMNNHTGSYGVDSGDL